MGNSGKSRFHQLEHESKTRLLKTHSHTSERLGYEARKKREEKQLKENACAMMRQTTVKNLPQTVSVAGGGETKKGD